MKEYDVIYESKHGKTIIGNVTAETERKALNLARKIYDGENGVITVSPV